MWVKNGVRAGASGCMTDCFLAWKVGGLPGGLAASRITGAFIAVCLWCSKQNDSNLG